MGPKMGKGSYDSSLREPRSRKRKKRERRSKLLEKGESCVTQRGTSTELRARKGVLTSRAWSSNHGDRGAYKTGFQRIEDFLPRTKAHKGLIKHEVLSYFHIRDNRKELERGGRDVSTYGG